MKQNDLISVIITIGNAQNTIERCLNGVLNQTYKNLEVLCVCNNISDNTEEIVKDYAQNDKRIKIVHSEPGIGPARNKGLSCAVGKYIIAIDADDLMKEETIESLYKTLLRDNSDMACSSYIRTNEKGEIYSKSVWGPEVVDQDGYYKYLLNDSTTTLATVYWGKLVKAEIYKQVEFPNFQPSQDSPVIHKLVSLCKRISLMPDTFFTYTKNSTSMSYKRRYDSLNCTIGYVERCAYFRDTKRKSFAKRTALKGMDIWIANYFKTSPNLKDKKYEQKAKERRMELVKVAETLNRNALLTVQYKAFKISPYVYIPFYLSRFIPRKLKNLKEKFDNLRNTF